MAAQKVRENERNWRAAGKLPSRILLLPKKSLLQTVHRAYIMPMIRKITKTSKPQLLHQGYFRKNCKNRVKRGVKCQMSNGTKTGEQNFALVQNFAPVRNFRTVVRKFCTPLLFFCSIFPSDFLSAMLSSTRILRAWIDSTNLA